MSWLSNLFGGGTDPMTQYLMDQRRRDDAAAEAARTQAAQDKADAAAKDTALRSSSSAAARTSANRYFQDQGLDPSAYSGDIDTRINEILGSTAEGDPNVGSYFGNLGESLYGAKQDAARSQALRGLDTTFSPDFENQRITGGLDDPILADINTQQRGKADNYLTNLLKRGVITNAGFQGGEKNLDEQGSRVRAQLDELGSGALATGRQGLTDIANRARGTASTLRLGSSFDPNVYSGEADKSFDDFLSGLGDRIKGSVTGNLYDTSGLGAIAGAAQGGQNTKFDPTALAGILSSQGVDTSNDPFTTDTSKKRSVF